VCCSVLQCVAVCCSVLQCVAVCCTVLQCVALCWDMSSTHYRRATSPPNYSIYSIYSIYIHIHIFAYYIYICICICIHIYIFIYIHILRRTASPPKYSIGWRTVIGCHLDRSFSAKEPYNWWLFCGKWPATEGILWVFATLFIYTYTHICIIHIYIYGQCLHRPPVYICIYTYLHNIYILCRYRLTISPTHHSINMNLHILS